MEKLNEIESEVPISGPGKALQRARTDLGLTVDDVAAQLHLAPRQIAAIESDDYKNLPQATYVRGYLRSYASLVGLSPDSVLQLYSGSAPAVGQKPVRLALVEADEGEHGAAHHVWWMTAGIGLVVVALAYAWWQGTAGPESAPVPVGAQQPAAPTVVDGADTPAKPSSLPPDLRVRDARPGAPVAVPRPPVVPAAKPDASASRHPAAPAPVTAASPSLAPAQAPNAQQQAPSEPTPANNPAEDAVPAQPVSDQSESEPEPIIKPARLVLKVDSDSWAEVRDARDNRLMYKTIAAGRVVSLTGAPPFQVFLGNADGVKVFVNDRAFDFSRYKRGVTARFSVDAVEPVSR